MNKKTKIIAGVSGATLAIAAVTGGIVYYNHSSQQALNAEFATAATELEASVNTLAIYTASLGALATDITKTAGKDSDLTKSVTALVDPVVEESLALITQENLSALAPLQGNLEPSVLDTVTSQTITDYVFGSVDAVTNTAQSDSQSGASTSIAIDEKIIELGYAIPGEDGTAQSDDTQSGDSSQSGDEPQSSDSDEVTYFTVTLPDADVTRENVDALKEFTEDINAQIETVNQTGVEVITLQYDAALESANTDLETADKTLTDKMAEAQKLLDSSKDKVSDNKTRESLKSAIESAEKVAKTGIANPEYLGNVVDLTAKKTEATKALDASIKTVNDSVAAKAEAERKAAEEAAAAAEAARQAELAAQQQYTQPDYGYNDYSGGSGYSDYGSGSGSYSGGGGSSSGSSGGGGIAIGGRDNPKSTKEQTEKCRIHNGVPNEYC